MRLALRYIIFSGIAFVMPSISFLLLAQDRCGTVPYMKMLHPDDSQKRIQFEKWMEQKEPLYRLSQNGRRQAASYKIPVVIHVIHNGEAIGTGANISDEQILSQIRVLNEDFNRLNADAVNTPLQFAGVAGALDIEFVLAKQDHDGLPTDGIVRINGGKGSWTMNDNYTLKNISYWPAEEYMNIWVCNLTDGHAGYAQFPQSDLPGMENSSTNSLTDGIVVWHRAFGSEADGSFSLDPIFNKGRTATHETGHFLGLNHIWGDDAGCNGTDHVSDTPNQASSTNGCPTHPRSDSCGEVVMFQNFLDYSNDGCMNLFTQGQVNRMIVVLENSPRRSTLLTSPGLQEPDPLPNDVGIRSIVFPDASVCNNDITPVIEVRNFGNNAVTGVRVRFVMDGSIQETKDFSLSLAPQEATEVAFTTLNIPSGSHDISFHVLSVNGTTDSGSYNDVNTSTVIVPAFANAPFVENFNATPTGWIVQNPDGQITWQPATAPSDLPSNKSLKLDYFNYEDKVGEVDRFISPVIDLTSAPAATLTFDVAHARYQSSNDRLQVIAFTDCQELSAGTVLYDKAGDALKTAPSTSIEFVPNEAQWRKELIDLSGFIGMDKVQIAFVGINDWGNNIYVDNIGIATELTQDVALIRMESPSAVTCSDQIAPTLLIQNSGSVVVNDLTVAYSLNGASTETLTLRDLNISFGAEKEISLPEIALMEGVNTLAVEIKDPNGGLDHNPANNTQSFSIIVNNIADKIPLRENFEDAFSPSWTVINPGGGMNWETTATNFGRSLFFNAFSNDQPGDEAWLVSPVLDLTETGQASVLFDLSHAMRNGMRETLRILGSKDCGITYQEVSFSLPDIETFDQSWSPQSASDWHRNITVNLNAFTGEENVRIAFVVRNQHANNLFLDNIEFFDTASPDPIEIDELYSVYGYDLAHPELSELKITFNLPERQNVRYSVINVTGQMETDGFLSDVLNQTYPLNLGEKLTPGVYFIRVEIGGKHYSTKIIVF